MGLKNRVALAGVAACALALGGCANIPFSAHSISLEDVKLEDVVGAIYLNTASADITPTPHGYVAFVYADGTVNYVRHSDMLLGRISWTKESLFFADSDKDYWLFPDGTATAISAPKAAYQDGLVVLEDGSTRIGLYNLGFDENNNDANQFAVASPGESEIEETSALFNMPVACGDEVYSVGRRPVEPYEYGDVEGLAGLNLEESVPLFQLSTQSTLAPRLVSNTPALMEATLPLMQPVCEGGTIVALMGASRFEWLALPSAPHEMHTYSPESFSALAIDQEYLTLEEWDADGQRRSTILLDEDGTPLLLEEQEGYFAKMAPGSVRDGTVYWVSGTGRLMVSERNTGMTRELARLRPSDSFQFSYYPSFGDGVVSVLIVDTDGKEPWAIERYSLDTGELVDSLELDGIAEATKGGQLVWDFAVNPVME